MHLIDYFYYIMLQAFTVPNFFQSFPVALCNGIIYLYTYYQVCAVQWLKMQLKSCPIVMEW